MVQLNNNGRDTWNERGTAATTCQVNGYDRATRWFMFMEGMISVKVKITKR